MSQWMMKVEQWLVALSSVFVHHPKRSLLAFLIVIVAMGQNLRFIELDPEMESFVSPTSDIRVDYSAVKEAFGRNDIVMLGLQGDVLSASFMASLQQLHTRLEDELPYVDDVTSLINAPFQQGSDNSLLVVDLVEELPSLEADFKQLEQRIQNSTLASTILVNDARTMALVMIEPATYDYGEQNQDSEDFDSAFEDAFSDDAFSTVAFEAPQEQQNLPLVTQFQLMDMIKEVELIMADYPQLSPILAGMPALNVALESTMKSEMAFFLRLTVALIVITLLLFFRQLAAVIAPVVALLSGLLLTFAVFVLAGQKIQIPLILLPTFLLAVTVGDAVHLLTHYYQFIRKGQLKPQAIHNAIKNTAIPMLLTSLTTAGGLLSLSVADVVPIKNLGIYAAIGVMLAFVLTITIVPALLMLLPQAAVKPLENDDRLSELMTFLSKVSWQYGGKIAVLWLIGSMLAFTQIVKLNFSHDPLNWMPASLPIVQATQVIDDQLSGTMTMDVVFDTGEPNGVKQLAFLTQLASWQESLESYSKGNVEVKGVNSIIDVIKESNRALQGGGVEHFSLPKTQSLINEELFLFENSAPEQLYQLVDSDFQKTRMTLILPWSDLMFYEGFVAELQAQGVALFTDHASVNVSGLIALLAGTMTALVYSAAFSYVIAAVVIGLMMMLLLNSIKLGVVAMIPNVAPIVIVMGLMYPLGIELDMLTILVATIAIGIAVDNTVHFTHHFRRGIEQGHALKQAMDDAFSGAGKALLTTCVVLAAGFYVFLFSDVSSIFNLGFLCGTSFVLAMLSNFTLTPFLLRWYFRNTETEKEHSIT